MKQSELEEKAKLGCSIIMKNVDGSIKRVERSEEGKHIIYEQDKSHKVMERKVKSNASQ